MNITIIKLTENKAEKNAHEEQTKKMHHFFNNAPDKKDTHDRKRKYDSVNEFLSFKLLKNESSFEKDINIFKKVCPDQIF